MVGLDYNPCVRRTTFAVAVFDIARNPLLAFKETIGWDQIKTLRLTNSDLWVMPHPLCREMLGQHGRLLRLDEKICLTGMVPESLRSLQKHQAEVSLGNSIPVPLVGTAIAPLLFCWSISTRSESMQSAGS